MNWQESTRRERINPADISFSDRTYYLPCYDDQDILVESIREIGILSPPVIKKNDSGLLIPVTGRRRIHAALEAKILKIEVLVADPALTEKQLVNLLFWDNFFRLRNNLVSISVMVARLLQVFEPVEVANRYLPWLGIPPRGPRLERLKLIAGLEERFLKALWSGRILEKTALILAANSFDERVNMLSFIEKYGWNANKSDEILQSVYDLSRLSGSEPAKIIQDAVDRVENANGGTETASRGEQIRSLIRQWKYSGLAESSASFELWLKNLGLPENVRVKPAQSFENESMIIEIRSPSRMETEKMMKKLSL